MSCKVDDKPCDGDGLICRLRPDDRDPYYYDEMGKKRSFYNCRCSNFRKGN